MGKISIYAKDGSLRHESVTAYNEDGQPVSPDSLEYSGSWMGECFVTVTFKSAYPVDFHIGDYIVYRNERFVLNYDPTVIKKSRRGTYGEGFTYDSVKFNSLSNELVETRFLDYVLYDNELHYTSLPVFPFYASGIDDFCDRLQANTNRYCKANGLGEDEYWLFLTPSKERTTQRAVASGIPEATAKARWEDAYGKGTYTSGEKSDISVNIESQSVWDAMSLIKSEFGLNFINRGRSVIVGAAGLPTGHLFKYGKGNGLYEIERVADTEQQVVTKLYAYGSETNLPVRYYATLNGQYYALGIHSTYNLDIITDIPWNRYLFTAPRNASVREDYIVRLKINGAEYGALAYMYNHDGAEKVALSATTAGMPVVTDGSTHILFLSGVKTDLWPQSHVDYTTGNLPNNMAVNRLMLPGFPNTSLYDWVLSNGGVALEDAGNSGSVGKAKWEGYTAFFSKDKYQPYLLSVNHKELGVREASKTFDGSDGSDEIYPTIEGTGYDIIKEAGQVSDNGIFDDGDDTPTVALTLPSFGADFKLDELVSLGTSAAVSMKDGFCGGRSFAIKSVSQSTDGTGTWKMVCEREHDTLLNLWFPYSYGASKGESPSASEPYQVCAGDKYVLTGIPMTSAYIDASARRLLLASLEYLGENDYTRYTFLPKVDEIYMAWQHYAVTNGHDEGKSLYETIKEGDIMLFEDEDLGIDGSVFIDQLTIKENGNNGIPTYEVTLRNDKQVATIQRIQEQISSISSTVSNGGGLNIPQIKSLIETYGAGFFISKKKDDSASGLITFLKGLVAKVRSVFEGGAWFGAFSKGSSGAEIDAEGNAEVEGLTVRRGLAVGRGFGIGEDGEATLGSTTTRDITNAGDLTTKNLHVTGSAHFFELVIDQIRSAGGAVMLTGANGFRVAAVKKLYDGKLYYEITYSLTFCRATTAPAQIAEDGTATVVLAAPDGSVHPSSVQVTGATARSYDAQTGTLVLAKATGEVTVTAWCYYIRYSLGPTLDWFDNKRGWVTPDYMAADGTAYIKVIPKEGYAMPDALQNVRQCTIDSYTPATGEIVISHPTGSDRKVFLTFWAERVEQPQPQTFAITYVLEGVEVVLLDESTGQMQMLPAPTTITEGEELYLYFMLTDDYHMFPDPEDVTVTGADYEYYQPTGELTLRNPTGPVTVRATGSRYLVEFSLNLKHMSVENLPEAYAGEYMLELTLVPDEGYRLPEMLGVSGGLSSFDWDPTTGKLVIENPWDVISIDGEAELVEVPQPAVYAVTFQLTNLVAEAGIDEITEDTQETVILSAPTGYLLPETVAVAGATLVSWNAQTGALAIANPTGPVTVTAVGTAQQQEEDWYATDALVLHLDGLDNGGRDVHLDSATVWKDLSAQGHDATSVSGAAVTFGATYAQFSSTAVAAAVGLAADSAWTVEYVPKYGADFGNQFAAGYWANPYIIGMGHGRLRVNNASGGIVYNNNGIGNHHGLAFTWEPGTGLKVYKDGALLAEVSSTAAMRAVPTLWLGYQADARSYAAGSVHALRVYARALTAAEVAANHALDAERFDF